MDALFYVPAVIAGALAMIAALPGGLALLAAGFALLRDSKIAQWIAVAVGILVALAAMRREARKQGRAEALKDVEAANRRAIAARKEVDAGVGRKTDSQVRDELKRWSR